MSKSNSRKLISDYTSLDTSRNSLDSIPSAFEKLKNINNNLLAAKHRLKVLKRKQVKQKSLEEIEQKKKKQKQGVQLFIYKELKLRQELGKKKHFELENIYRRNQINKQKNKQMIQKIKEQFFLNNKSTFENLKKNRMKNENTICSYRRQIREQKSRKRQRISNEEKIARKSVQNFKISRFSTIKKNKTMEVNQIMKKVMIKYNYLEQLGEVKRSLQTSRSSLQGFRDSQINPEKIE